MLKYVAAAGALKLFSINSTTKRAYRAIGNSVGSRTRKKGLKPGYIERADRNLAMIEAQNGIRDGMKLVELGTGWTHWEALFTRCFYDVEITLFDVWDNRQFDGFIAYAEKLREGLAARTARAPDQVEKAVALLDEVIAMPHFDAIYRRLGFRYLIDATGSLAAIGDDSIDLIISSDVLEHVDRDAMPLLAADMMRILRPGGMASQQIVPADHLTIYDRSVNAKNYLQYSDLQWKMFFENGVQYINRLQHSDFVRIFTDAGFELVVDEITSKADISALKIHPRFAGYSQDDLRGVVSTIIARKRAVA